jgi:ABC-type multidrug transport system fused ATPase/permease subunit
VTLFLHLLIDLIALPTSGLTLSGGQKARITLARAVYARADILLLDDVLSALDVQTARWIVEKCLGGDVLAGRTVILIVSRYTSLVRGGTLTDSLSLQDPPCPHGQ